MYIYAFWETVSALLDLSIFLPAHTLDNRLLILIVVEALLFTLGEDRKFNRKV